MTLIIMKQQLVLVPFSLGNDQNNPELIILIRRTSLFARWFKGTYITTMLVTLPV